MTTDQAELPGAIAGFGFFVSGSRWCAWSSMS